MKIYAVIVCYKPEIPGLKMLCKSLIKKNAEVIIIDNTEQSYLSEPLSSLDCKIIALQDNTGIAHAQNIGINYCLERGADVVVFFDQDSSIDDDFLPKLLAPLQLGVPLVSAPVFFDKTNRCELPSFVLNRFGILEKVYACERVEPYMVDVVISSGSAVTKEVFEVAGKMDEDFFIDFVDIEWALRCRKNNIPILIIPSAKMLHSIGEASIKLKLLTISLHSPERSYYKIRNSFLILRKRNVPILLGIKEVLAAIVHQAVAMIFVINRLRYLKNYLTGIEHGLLGITGKKPSKYKN